MFDPPTNMLEAKMYGKMIAEQYKTSQLVLAIISTILLASVVGIYALVALLVVFAVKYPKKAEVYFAEVEDPLLQQIAERSCNGHLRFYAFIGVVIGTGIGLIANIWLSPIFYRVSQPQHTKSHVESPVVEHTNQIETIIEEMKIIAKALKLKQSLVFPFTLYSTTPSDVMKERGVPFNAYTNGGYLYYLYTTPDGSAGTVFVFENRRLILIVDVLAPPTDEVLAHLANTQSTIFEYLYGSPQICKGTTSTGQVIELIPAKATYKFKNHTIDSFIIGWFDKTLKGIMLIGCRYPTRSFMVLYGNLEWFLRYLEMFWSDIYKLAQPLF
ncbi:MAG: hypothetical protein ACP6IP_11045 [Candidatus Njordarchaeia archaeon]